MASEGYDLAGWHPTGIDIELQPLYPYPFSQMDMFHALSEWQHLPSVIHASPPCQAVTRARHLRDAQGGQSRYPDLLTPTLKALRSISANARLTWIVENVEAARPLMQPQPGEYLARVCGSSFGLQVQRHRLFLSNVPIEGTVCDHGRFPLDPVTGKPRPWGVYHVAGDSIPQGGRTAVDKEHGSALFGLNRVLPWDKLKEGFPPVYTFYIGRQVLEALGVAA